MGRIRKFWRSVNYVELTIVESFFATIMLTVTRMWFAKVIVFVVVSFFFFILSSINLLCLAYLSVSFKTSFTLLFFKHMSSLGLDLVISIKSAVVFLLKWIIDLSIYCSWDSCSTRGRAVASDCNCKAVQRRRGHRGRTRHQSIRRHLAHRTSPVLPVYGRGTSHEPFKRTPRTANSYHATYKLLI